MENNEVDVKLDIHVNQTKQATGNDEGKDRSAWVVSLPAVFFLILILHSLSEWQALKLLWWFIALLHAAIYSKYAFRIHNIDESQIKNNWYKNNQYWFNGLGVFSGWVALYILLFYRIEIDNTSLQLTEFFRTKMQLLDFTLAAVAFLGLTGHLPFVSLLGKKP